MTQRPPSSTAAPGATAGEPSRSRVGRRYEVRELLGTGGMADVFRATDRLRGEDVALKVLKPALGARRDHITSEFRFITKLRHPGIVRVFDYGLTDEGEPFFTMELCEGPDLYAYSSQVGARRAVFALRQAVATLGFVHARGVVHADLKPSNILMARAPSGALVPRLLDFGIAWEVLGHAGESTGRMGGTAHFMAPEAAEGVRSVATDLYALGVMLFQLLTGRFPFEGDTIWDLLDAHLRTPAPDPRAFSPEAPPALCELALRLLEKSPADRPEDAAEVVASLDAWLGGEATDFAPRAASLAVQAEPLLVGREGASEALLAAVGPGSSLGGASPARPPDAGAPRVPKVFVISGQAGMGKTRLLHEARLGVQLRGGVTISLTGARGEGPRAVLGRLEAALEGSFASAPRSARGAQGREPGLLALAHAVGDALGALVERRGGAFVTFDDLHRVGPEAARLLLVALQRAARPGLTIAVSVRPAGARGGRWPVEVGLGDVAAVERLELTRLGLGELEALVTSVLGDVDDLGAVASQLLREAGGVPGPSVAALRAWVATGALVPRGGAWGVAAHLQGRLPRPPEGEAVAEAALAGLAPAARRVALAASALGESFDLELLTAVLERDLAAPEVGDAVRVLLREDLLEPWDEGGGGPRGGGGSFRFVQDAVRRVLRGDLPPEDARRWACRAAQALGRRRARGAGVSLELLASLLVDGGAGIEAVEVARDAARELVAAGYALRAVEVLRRATDGRDVSSLEPVERQAWARGRLRLGELAARVGDTGLAARALASVAELEGSRLSPLVRAARRQLGELELAQTDDEERGVRGEQLLREVMRQARGAADWRELALAAVALAHHCAVKGRQEEAAELAREAHAAAAEAGDPVLLGRARKEQGTVAWYSRALDEAAAAAREAAEVLVGAGEAEEAARALGLLGNIALRRGDLGPAGEAFERARRHAEAGGWLVGVAMIFNSLAQVRYYELDWDAARDLWIEARKIDDLTEQQVERCIVRNNLGLLALYRGAYVEARGLFAEALSIAERVGLMRERARTLGNLGELHRRMGALEEARAALAEADRLARAADGPDIVFEVATSRLAVDIDASELASDATDEALAQGLTEAAERLLEQAGAQGGAEERVRLGILLARVLARQERDAEARVTLVEAFEAAPPGGLDRARVVLAAAELSARGVSGLGALTDRLESAVRVAQRLRAQPLLARARALGIGGERRGGLGPETVPAWPTSRFEGSTGVAPAVAPEEAAASGGERSPRAPCEGSEGGDDGGRRDEAWGGPARLLAFLSELGEIEDLGAILERVVDEALIIARAERGFVILVDATGRTLVRVARPAEQGVSPGLTELSRTVVRRALEEGVAVTYGGGEDVAPSVSAAALGRAITALPLRWRARPVGVLYLDGPAGGGSPSAAGELDALAVHLAALLRNAWLLEEHRRRADALLTVAQELVHPLTTILGYAALLEAGGARQDHARTIRTQARRAASVLEHLVEVGHLEGRALAWTMVSVQVKDLVFSALEQAEPLAAMAGVRIRADVAPQLPTVWGNRDRLVQALATLLVEGVARAQRGGSLLISARAEVLATGRLRGGAAPAARTELWEDCEARPPLSPDRVVLVQVGAGSRSREAPAASAGGVGREEPPSGPARGAGATGLLLAQRIVERHGGRLEAHEPAEHPRMFTAELPTLG